VIKILEKILLAPVVAVVLAMASIGVYEVWKYVEWYFAHH